MELTAKKGSNHHVKTKMYTFLNRRASRVLMHLWPRLGAGPYGAHRKTETDITNLGGNEVKLWDRGPMYAENLTAVP